MNEPSSMGRILVVDDAPDTLEVLRRNLAMEGYQVFTAPGVEEATRVLENTPIDLVVTDMKMPGMNGLDLIRHIRENLTDTEVMMITGYATVEGAVEAVKTGAEAYLAKPFTDEELLSAVRGSLEKLKQRRAARNSGAVPNLGRYGLLGDSPAMKAPER